jgi:hypothetical protein
MFSLKVKDSLFSLENQMYATLVAKPMDTWEVVVATYWHPKMIEPAGTWHWVSRIVPPAGSTKLLVVTAEVTADPHET